MNSFRCLKKWMPCLETGSCNPKTWKVTAPCKQPSEPNQMTTEEANKLHLVHVSRIWRHSYWLSGLYVGKNGFQRSILLTWKADPVVLVYCHLVSPLCQAMDSKPFKLSSGWAVSPTLSAWPTSQMMTKHIFTKITLPPPRPTICWSISLSGPRSRCVDPV